VWCIVIAVCIAADINPSSNKKAQTFLQMFELFYLMIVPAKDLVHYGYSSACKRNIRSNFWIANFNPGNPTDLFLY
jgi:hypothetical protein